MKKKEGDKKAEYKICYNYHCFVKSKMLLGMAWRHFFDFNSQYSKITIEDEKRDGDISSRTNSLVAFFSMPEKGYFCLE